MGVKADEVEVELVESGFGKEIAPAGEGFQIEEFIFDETMDGFDVAVVGVGTGGNADVVAVVESGGEAGGAVARVVAADELAAVVGLPDQVAEIDAIAGERAPEASGEDGTGGGTATRWAKARKRRPLRTSRAVPLTPF